MQAPATDTSLVIS